jgi:hypothetical protein
MCLPIDDWQHLPELIFPELIASGKDFALRRATHRRTSAKYE